MKRILTTAASLAVVALGTASLRAQVLLNEIEFESGKQWIELYNAGATNVDLGSWSIYQATKTPNRFQDYWWPFPTGTVIKSKDYLRVLWAQDVITPADPRDVYTGRSNWYFLFGHGYEALDPAAGAVAICKTQLNTQVNNPNIFADWWQWGGTGFLRESIAIATTPTSLWNANTFLPVVPAGKSLMRLEDQDSLPHPIDAFRFDASPTPLAANAADWLVNIYGDSCSYNHPTGTKLRVEGIPFHGNTEFGITTVNTLGPAFFESMLYIINVSGGTQTYFYCTDVVLDTSGAFLLTPLFPTQTGATTLGVPLTPPAALGSTVFIQAVSFSVDHFSFSDRLQLRVSK